MIETFDDVFQIADHLFHQSGSCRECAIALVSMHG